MSATLHDRPFLVRRLSRVRRHARRVLWMERAWPQLHGVVAATGLYILAGLLRVPQSLPDWARVILLVCFVSTVVIMTIRGWRRIVDPTVAEMDRQIERASRLPFQPLLALQDHPATTGEPALWHLHIERVMRGIGVLRAGWPKPRLTPWDRGGAAFLLAALLTALVLAGTSAPSRILAAFVPGMDDADVPLPRIQAWIDLPSYAPGAPQFLGERDGTASVPQGARLTAILTGTMSHPYLSGATTSARDDRALDRRSWALHASLDGSGTLRLKSRWRTIAQWQMQVRPDLAPDVAWDGKPQVVQDTWRLKLPWKVAQAYGVQSLQAEMRLHGRSNPRVLKVPVPLNGAPKDAHGVSEQDLSADPWAGEQVDATLYATSVSGLHARSKPVTFRLPARSFHDPVAKAIIATRHRLALGEQTRVAAADDLRALTEVLPLRETGVILSLDLAASQLTDPDDADAREQVIGLTWAVALYLEDLRETDRETALANLDIRAAQAAVQTQIAHMKKLGHAGQVTAEQEELAQRMKTLRQAIDRRMQALMRQAMQNGTMLPETSQDQGDADDAFARLMRRLQSDATNGHGDDAMRRLQQLEEMTSRMRNATPQDLANMAQQMRAQAEAQAQRHELHDLVKRQAALLDHTQSRLSAQRRANSTDQDEDSPGGSDNQDLATMSTPELLRRLGLQQPPSEALETRTDTAPPPADPAVEATHDEERRKDHAVQSALRRVDTILNDAVKQTSGKPLDGLKKADKDMAAARHALAHGQDDAAQQAEQQALKDLAEAGKQMSDAQKAQSKGGGPIALLPGFSSAADRQGGGKAGQGQGDDSDSDGADADRHGDRDPLGRKLGKGNQGMDTDGHIPEADQRARAREIERELRRRDADRTRPRSELDYLDRLLKSY
ncbi:hypothetical protein AA101099_0859 [Neoasaia chiangmaiensis NBRC 101099]|uniref:TIGR02302 family protein n=1 Tax=Neoasaia chiangmaiensis TaxID=320497 RepID=A0A1U9KMI8_9PROT|nr:DUF4175 family protein [Neoasaia chiangmaiensis]AQS86978.1 hypothetical protein A0U93_02365 [Neoasaia chiangmaiensis]GBR37739.1 hypothetical protein AA101099_0859 [Neoasaia chiangmaiensis NBRC 101099]